MISTSVFGGFLVIADLELASCILVDKTCIGSFVEVVRERVDIFIENFLWLVDGKAIYCSTGHTDTSLEAAFVARHGISTACVCVFNFLAAWEAWRLSLGRC